VTVITLISPGTINDSAWLWLASVTPCLWRQDMPFTYWLTWSPWQEWEWFPIC